MKKARSAFILCLAFILICTTHLTLVPVSSASIKDTKFHVQFNSNGGSYCPPVYDVLYGTSIDLPNNPTRYNYWFRGWYCDSAFTIRFDSNTKIYSNLVVYAKWEQKGNPPYILSQRIGTEGIESTVTIDISKQTYGSACKMNLHTYEHHVLQTLVYSISKTEKYLGFELNVDDLNFSKDNPLPVRVRIPSGFNSTNTAVFYSTNRVTVSGKPECYVNNNGEYTNVYTFYGTYLLYSGRFLAYCYFICIGFFSYGLRYVTMRNFRKANYTGINLGYSTLCSALALGFFSSYFSLHGATKSTVMPGSASNVTPARAVWMLRPLS